MQLVPHTTKHVAIFWIICQIVDHMWIGLEVVEFFGRFGLEEPILDRVQLSLFVQPCADLRGGHRQGVAAERGPRQVGQEIPVVLISIITHHTDRVVPLRHAIADGKRILPGRPDLRAQEGLSLHVPRHIHAQQRQQAWAGSRRN